MSFKNPYAVRNYAQALLDVTDGIEVQIRNTEYSGQPWMDWTVGDRVPAFSPYVEYRRKPKVFKCRLAKISTTLRSTEPDSMIYRMVPDVDWDAYESQYGPNVWASEIIEVEVTK